MTQLSIFLLGSFRVALNGEPVMGFVSDKARALLAFLAVEAERAHRRETLAGLLWPEYPERSARANLRNVLANVRQVIGDREADPPFLCIARQTVQFNPEGDSQVDVRAFAEGLEFTGDSPAARSEAIHEMEAAIALYQGEFLEGFSLPDSVAFEEWALLKREQLQRQALAALGRLADHYERQGDYERALQFAWRRVEVDPYRGVAQRGLMRLLALSGQREAALAQYETFRRLLAEEMGVAPAEETTRLCEQIQAGELAPPVGARESLAPRHNLPAQTTPFIGREDELAAIRAWLSDPDCRLLTLIGPGGSGKTRLVLQAAAGILSDAQLDSFKHGVFFVSLAPLRSVDGIVPTVAQALGFSFYEGGEPRQQLLDYLRQKHLLLILDNFEHLLSYIPSSESEGSEDKRGESLVIDILKTAPGVKVLTTSRARLNLQSEHLFPVGGMDLPSLQSCEDAEQYDAVELFLAGARRVEPGFELVDDNVEGVVRVCRLVEGMPLGILLAAAWTRMLTPRGIADQIEQNIDLLATEECDVPARQRSIRATLDYSWRLLTEREQVVFRALSVFRGGFTREAARAVTEASLQELMALMDKSLLNRAPTGRYEVHELLRQYAEEKLDQGPAAGKAARDRHCAYYTAALQQWEADSRGPRRKAALAEMDVEIENARVAWDWAAEWVQVERLDQAMEGLFSVSYCRRARYDEGETACRAAASRLASARKLAAMASGDGPALSAAEGSVDEVSVAEGPVLSAVEGLRVLARILMWQTEFSQLSGREGCDQLQLLRQSLAVLEGPELAGQDTRAEKAYVLHLMGWRAYDSEQARRMFEQSLALYRAVGDRWRTGRELEALSYIMTKAFGAYDRARQLAEESLAIWRELGNPIGVANSLKYIGWNALYLGQFEEAERLLRESNSIFQRETGALGNPEVAWGLLWLGQFDEAHSICEERLASFISSDREGFFYTPFLRASLGYVKAHLGQYEQARVQLQTSLAILRERHRRVWIADTCFMLGSVAMAEEAYAEAWQLLEEGVAISQETRNLESLNFALAVLGYAARGLGRLPQTERHFYEALRSSAEVRSFIHLLLVLPGIALLLADQGEKERAVELYALASRYPAVANSRWFEDVAGRHIAEVAAALPPEVVAAAQERGRARDLDATVKELLVEFGEERLR